MSTGGAKKLLVFDDDDSDSTDANLPLNVAEFERQVRVMLSEQDLATVSLRQARAQMTARHGYNLDTQLNRETANDIIRRVVNELTGEQSAPDSAPPPPSKPAAPKATSFFDAFGDADDLSTFASSAPVVAPKKAAAKKAAPAPSTAARPKLSTPLTGPPPVSFTVSRDEAESNALEAGKPAAPKGPSPAKAAKAPALPGPVPQPDAAPPAEAKPDRTDQVKRPTSAPKRTQAAGSFDGGASEIGKIFRAMDSDLAATLARMDDETPSDTMLVELHLKLTATFTDLMRAFDKNRIRSAVVSATPARAPRAPRKPAAKTAPASSSSSAAAQAAAPAPADDEEEGWVQQTDAEIGRTDAQLVRAVLSAAKATIADLANLYVQDVPELLQETADLLESEVAAFLPLFLREVYAMSRSIPIKEMETNAQLVYPVEKGELFGVPQSGAGKLLASSAVLPALEGGRIVAMCTTKSGLRNVYAVMLLDGSTQDYRLMHLAQGFNPWADTGFRAFRAGLRVIDIDLVDDGVVDRVALTIMYETERTPFLLQQVHLDARSQFVGGKILAAELGKSLGAVQLAGSALGGNSLFYGQLDADGLFTVGQFDLIKPKLIARAGYRIEKLNTQGVRPVVVASRKYVAVLVVDISAAFQDSAARAVIAKSNYYLGIRVLMWRVAEGSTALQLVAVTSLVVEGFRETLAEQFANLPCCLSDEGALLFAIGPQNSVITYPTRIYRVRAFKTGSDLVYEGEPTTQISETAMLSGQTGQLLVTHADGALKELLPSYAPGRFAWQLSA